MLDPVEVSQVLASCRAGHMRLVAELRDAPTGALSRASLIAARSRSTASHRRANDVGC
jgi:hypothetical protein